MRKHSTCFIREEKLVLLDSDLQQVQETLMNGDKLIPDRRVDSLFKISVCA